MDECMQIPGERAGDTVRPPDAEVSIKARTTGYLCAVTIFVTAVSDGARCCVRGGLIKSQSGGSVAKTAVSGAAFLAWGRDESARARMPPHQRSRGRAAAGAPDTVTLHQLLKLVDAGVPTSRKGYLQTSPETFPRPALSREEAA